MSNCITSVYDEVDVPDFLLKKVKCSLYKRNWRITVCTQCTEFTTFTRPFFAMTVTKVIGISTFFVGRINMYVFIRDSLKSILVSCANIIIFFLPVMWRNLPCNWRPLLTRGLFESKGTAWTTYDCKRKTQAVMQVKDLSKTIQMYDVDVRRKGKKKKKLVMLLFL